MFGLFSKRPVIEPEIADWVWESFAWAARKGFLTAATPLVLPTPAFFHTKGRDDPDATVRGLVGDLQRLLGIEDIPVQVAPLAVLPDAYRNTLDVTAVTGGTWEETEDGALVHYDPNLIDQPTVLIATLTHELMHGMLAPHGDDTPGGAEAHELSTDLHCITTGHGLIQMLGGEDAGWSGYLQQPTRGYALALFLAATGRMTDVVHDWLPPRPAGYVTRAAQEIAADAERLAALKAALTA